MKANKVTVVITVEALSIASVPFKVEEATEAIRREVSAGKLVSDDGDTVAWETTTDEVEF